LDEREVLFYKARRLGKGFNITEDPVPGGRSGFKGSTIFPPLFFGLSSFFFLSFLFPCHYHHTSFGVLPKQTLFAVNISSIGNTHHTNKKKVKTTIARHIMAKPDRGRGGIVGT
jgi:hypothetical protein